MERVGDYLATLQKIRYKFRKDKELMNKFNKVVTEDIRVELKKHEDELNRHFEGALELPFLRVKPEEEEIEEEEEEEELAGLIEKTTPAVEEEIDILTKEVEKLKKAPSVETEEAKREREAKLTAKQKELAEKGEIEEEEVKKTELITEIGKLAKKIPAELAAVEEKVFTDLIPKIQKFAGDNAVIKEVGELKTAFGKLEAKDELTQDQIDKLQRLVERLEKAATVIE
jgi:HAMP domain-containing protein